MKRTQNLRRRSFVGHFRLFPDGHVGLDERWDHARLPFAALRALLIREPLAGIRIRLDTLRWTPGDYHAYRDARQIDIFDCACARISHEAGG